MVVLCMVIASATPAWADKRPVAVIDLTLGNDPRVEPLAQELDGLLAAHDELARLPSPAYEAALLGVPPDDDQQRLSSAQKALQTADEALAKFKFPTAEAAAQTGMSGLGEVTPRAAAPLLGQLAFAHAQGLLGTNRKADALLELALVHAITPNRPPLDPDQFFPEVIEAYAAARPIGLGTIDVRGTGEIWIDGIEYGAAPRAIQVGAGRHFVQLTGVERETRGAIATVGAGATVAAEIPDAVATDEEKIRRARLALAHANGSVERASTMGRLAKLIGVGDAILLSQVDGKLMVQTWRDRAPGFSRVQERGTQTAAELLLPIAPPPAPKILTPPIIIPIPEVPRWYLDRRVQVGAAIGVVAIVVASIVWARSGTHYQPPTGDIGFMMQ